MFIRCHCLEVNVVQIHGLWGLFVLSSCFKTHMSPLSWHIFLLWKIPIVITILSQCVYKKCYTYSTHEHCMHWIINRWTYKSRESIKYVNYFIIKSDHNKCSHYHRECMHKGVRIVFEVHPVFYLLSLSFS